MAMEVSPEEFARAELVFISSPEGEYRWSSNRGPEQVAEYLHKVADDIALRIDMHHPAPHDEGSGWCVP